MFLQPVAAAVIVSLAICHPNSFEMFERFLPRAVLAASATYHFLSGQPRIDTRHKVRAAQHAVGIPAESNELGTQRSLNTTQISMPAIFSACTATESSSSTRPAAVSLLRHLLIFREADRHGQSKTLHYYRSAFGILCHHLEHERL